MIVSKSKLNNIKRLMLMGCMLLVFSNQAVAQSPAIVENHVSTGVEIIHPGSFTWVAYSTSDYEQAVLKLKSFGHEGREGKIVKSEVDKKIHFRIIFGSYHSRNQAIDAKSQWASLLPEDAWLLIWEHDFILLETEASNITLPFKEEAGKIRSVENKDQSVITTNISITPNTEHDTSPRDFSSEPQTLEINQENIETDASVDRSFSTFLNRHFESTLQFSNVYEDNIDHDADFEAVQSYGMVPSLEVQFRSASENPLFTFQYRVARHAYSNTERWDRVSNAFSGVFEPQLGDAFNMQTSVEVSLKGSSEDRDISNQFQVVQELEYRFTRRHRLQLYGTYRIKRFPDQEGAQDFKPNFGVNFERTNSDGERFESGARYEFNKEEEARGNYRRWTFTVEYRTPEIGKRDQFELGIKHRRKFYTARFVEIEDEDFLRQDNRLSIGVRWAHEFNRGVSMELGYEFETRSSNDPEKLYDANAFSLAMIYEL